MARNLDGVNDDIVFGSNSSVEPTSTLTLGVWFKSTNVATTQTIMRRRVDTLALAIVGSKAWFQIGNRNVNNGNLSSNTWHSVMLAWDNSDESGKLRCYLDGADVSTTKTATGTLTYSADDWIVGSNSSNQFFSGDVARAYLWNVKLSANEATAFARGVNPLRIRRTSLKFLAELQGFENPERDFANSGLSGTLTGTSRANHAPVEPLRFLPPITMPVIETAAAPTGSPILHHMRRMVS